MKYTFRHIALKSITAIAITLSPGMAVAQNNIYKIHDSLYPSYLDAFRNRGNRQGLLKADTLRQRAIGIGDHKAEILAMLVTADYYSSRPDSSMYPKLHSVVSEIRRKALKYDYLQYYYYTTNVLVSYLADWGKYPEALKVLNEDSEFAKQYEHPYGIYTTLISMGDIHLARREFTHALKYYTKACEFGKKNMTAQITSSVYPMLCEASFAIGRFQQTVDWALEGLPISYSEQNIGTLYGYKVLSYLMLGDYDRFKSAYTEYEKYHEAGLFMPNEYLQILDKVPNILASDKMPMTWNRTDSLSQEGYYMRYVDAHYHNRFRDAAQLLDQILKQMMTSSKDNIMNDMTELYTGLTERTLKLQAQETVNKQAKLQLENAQLELSNATLELGNAENIKRLAELAAQRNSLLYNNQKQKSAQLQDAINDQKKMDEYYNARRSSQNFFILLFSIIVTAAIVMALTYLFRHRKMERKLSQLAKRSQETLEEANEASRMAKEADKQKTVFIQNMSHEVRTPLNAIVGFTQILTDASFAMSKEDKDEITNRITENSEVLSTLVNDILDLTSIESGKYQMILEEVNINELCHEALSQTENRQNHNVEMRLKSDFDDNATMVTDRQRTLQVLYELLTNAIKNTTEGRITLACSDMIQKGFYTFEVTDTGVGVPQGMMDEIFERFKKVDAFKQGTGLGLDICRAISKRLGGTVDIDHNYNNGARFWFTISKNLKVNTMQQ